jgi:transcriptional regulator with XRE-family HTH domain
MSDLARQLGKRIYLFRKQNKLTQAALAEKAKISNEFMSGIERGAKLPSLPTLERIAKALKIGIKDVFNFDQGNFRQAQFISRLGIDMALLVENASPERRAEMVKIMKILSETR